MVDANLLKQLENSLNLYQETQETLDVVVQNAQFLFGEEWMDKLPIAFDNEPLDMPTKIILKDKANHVVHYYGALAAWQEASTYLTDPSTTTAQMLAERIPVLEYWLALFGNEGNDLVAQVKALYVRLNQETEEVQTPILQPSSISQEAQNISEETLPTENVIVSTPEEQAMPIVEQVIPTVTAIPETISEPVQNEPVAEQPTIQETTASSSVQSPQQEEAIFQVMPETFREPPLQTEENTVESLPMVSTPSIEEETKQSQSTSEPQTETIQEELPTPIIKQPPVWEDRNTAGEVSLEELVDFDVPVSHPAAISSEEVIDASEVMEGSSKIVTQNWDLANFLRQKRLYDDANNWLSAWCIRMDNAEKIDYPHYGFIVDVMHDLKEKIQIVLENQLLEEVVEREIPGGRESMERLAVAIDKELEDLPDDFKLPTAEKIKLNAKEILGAMDVSEEKEFIGPAPDGFELMDDPYAASTEQILSDFEKTEEEAQNQIDKLNVIEDNEKKQEKDW